MTTAYLMLVTSIQFENEIHQCHKYVAVNDGERFFNPTVKVGDSPELMDSTSDSDGLFNLTLIGTVVQMLE
jgi:hypothetical protein